MNILIVGAGPTGLTAALELTRQGVSPTVVDGKEAPSSLSRAVGILPKSIETLNRTGVGDELLAAGVKIQRININRDGNTLIDVDISDITDDKFLVGLPQDETESIMSQRLSELGVEVQYGTKVTGIETTSTVATATFADGRKETYDWIIGADGVLSTVRESLSIPFEGYELDETWSIADLRLVAGAYDTEKITAWMLDNNRSERDAMVMFPMGANRVRLVSSTPDSVAALPINLDIKEVMHTGTFRISVRQAKQYRKGRVLLAGDAAHAHSPVGGRGMNLGIDDGQAVAAAIINDATDAYAKERRVKARRVIDGTERARKLVLSNNPVTVFGLKLIGWLVSNVRFIQKIFIKNITKL